MSSVTHSRPLFEASIVRPALVEAFKKLDPRRMVKNPVMFVVEVGSAFTTLLFVHAAVSGHGDAPAGFILAVASWLWFTVLFANFAEAMAEGRGKAQAATLRKARQDVLAHRVKRGHAEAAARRGGTTRGRARSWAERCCSRWRCARCSSSPTSRCCSC